jgi:hypothetical protein
MLRSSCAQGRGAYAAESMERAGAMQSLRETGSATMPESLAREAATSTRAQKRSDAKGNQGAEGENEECVMQTPMNRLRAGRKKPTHG